MLNGTADLIAVTSAQEQILRTVGPLESEPCFLSESLGRVLAEPLVAAISVPPFDNSAMDGFAIRASDALGTNTPTGLTIVGLSQAGAADAGSIGAGQAARIMTGAPMPRGADAVVPVEDAVISSETVSVPAAISIGQCVRKAGLDVRPGDVLLDAGTRLGSAQIALAASVGAFEFSVTRRPRVAILTTGDELVEPGQPLGPGQIYNSNAYGLAASVLELGAIPLAIKPARDDPGHLRDILQTISDVDLLITAGGVSVGDFDYVKQVVAEFGSVDFWRVRMRPGKPLMMGSITPGGGGPSIPVLGLPGNPTSAMVTFHVFAKPAILKLMGIVNPLPPTIRAETLEAFDNRGGRETYFRVRVSQTYDGFTIRLAGGQDSSMLRPLAAANGFARIPYDIEQVAEGETVDVIPFGLGFAQFG